MDETADLERSESATTGFVATVLAVIVLFFGGLFVVDSIGALESDGDCGTATRCCG